MKAKKCLLLMLFVALALPASVLASASFQGLGDLPGGNFASNAYCVSANGSTAAGSSLSTASTPFQETFYWTKGSGIVGLGFLTGGSFSSSGARGISADGSVIVGQGQSSSGGEAFRWTSSTGMVGLGDLPGGSFLSTAYGVSADGSVIVGRGSSDAGAGTDEAFRWENGTMTGLGGLSGDNWRSYAYNVSADGSVVVGGCVVDSPDLQTTEAFRWENGTMVGIGKLTGGQGNGSRAWGVSADGSVVVGYSSSEAAGWGQEAFRWEDGVMIGLGDLPGGYFHSIAQATSADGSVIVGSSVTVGSVEEAFIWDELNGMQNLKDVLTNDYGLDLTGWTLQGARGISDDGLTIVGVGSSLNGTEAWIATIPEPASMTLLLIGGAVLLRRRK